MEPKIARTVSELITTLMQLESGATVFAHEPPFTGVKVVPQANGGVYIASLGGTEEDTALRAQR